MRNILFTLLFVLQAVVAFAQKVVIANDRQNIVYIGIPNSLTVAVEDHSSGSIVVKTDVGTMTRKDDGTYELMVTEQGEVNLEVFLKKGGHLKKVGAALFRARYLPNPTAKVGGKSGGVMPPAIFRAQLGLAAYLDGFDLNAKYKITGFYMVVIRDGEVIFGHANEGTRFDETIKNFMERVKKKDKIIFAEIRVKTPDGRETRCAALELRLEDHGINH